MDVGDHEFLQVRTLIGDTDELRHNLYVLSYLQELAHCKYKNHLVFMVSSRIVNRWDFTKSLYICKFQVNMVLG